MTKDRSRGITRSKWFLPSFSFVLGLVILAVAWLGGQPGEGVVALVGLTAFGLFFLLAGRSETDPRAARRRPRRAVRADRPAGDRGRRVGPDRRADRRLASGHRPGAERQPYDWLLAIGGLAYLLAVAWFRWRG